MHDIACLPGATAIKFLPPSCPLAVSAADFHHAAQLIARACRSSLEWINSGDIDLPDPGRFLALHDHRQEGIDVELRTGPDRRHR